MLSLLCCACMLVAPCSPLFHRSEAATGGTAGAFHRRVLSPARDRAITVHLYMCALSARTVCAADS